MKFKTCEEVCQHWVDRLWKSKADDPDDYEIAEAIKSLDDEWEAKLLVRVIREVESNYDGDYSVALSVLASEIRYWNHP